MSYYPRSYFEDMVNDWFKLLGYSYLRNVRYGIYEVDFIITHPVVAVVEVTSWGVVLMLEEGKIKAYGYDLLQKKIYRNTEVYYRKFHGRRKNIIRRILSMHNLNPDIYEEWLIVWSIYEDEVGLAPRIEPMGLGRSSNIKVLYYTPIERPNLKIMTINTILYHTLCYYRYGGGCNTYKWIEPIGPTHGLLDGLVYQFTTLGKENLLNNILQTLRTADKTKYTKNLPKIQKPCTDLLS